MNATPEPHRGDGDLAHTEHTPASSPAATAEISAAESARRAAVAAFPYAAVTVTTTGIHPNTARIVALDIVCFDAAGTIGETFHTVIDPKTTLGPRHYHGLGPEDIAEAASFSRYLKTLDRLLDERTVIVHDLPPTWGFILSESRRAMTAAARANRARSRGRGRNKRRQRVGHIPRPTSLVDTLATAQRAGVDSNDIRLAAIARASGLSAPDPTASVARAARSHHDTAREATRLVIDLFLHQQQHQQPLTQYTPAQLKGDKFGLQRSAIRVEAANAPAPGPNPGVYRRRSGLRPGMEFVVAPELSADPDEIIAAGFHAGLRYSEKLSRETSVVVCNKRDDLVGKPMHAVRKDIPLLSDSEFLSAVAQLTRSAPAGAATDDAPSPRSAQSSAAQSGPRRRGRRRARSAGQTTAANAAASNASAATTGKPAAGNTAAGNAPAAAAGNAASGASAARPATEPTKPPAAAANTAGSQRGGATARRRRRRGGRRQHGGEAR